MAKYLITGGAGFIGCNAVRVLLDRGDEVRVLDNLATGREENLDEVRDQIDFIEGDLTDADTAAEAVRGMDNVVHLGALPSVARSVKDPVTSSAVNIGGTLNMLIACRDAGVKRFVMASSSSVYGDTEVLPKVETMRPRPLSPYAAQKMTAEYYCRMFYPLYGLETFAMRYFNVFGPRQNPDSQYAAVCPIFIKALQEQRSPIIYGDGEQTRDFTFVTDAVGVTLACCEAPAESAGQAYNVAGGKRVSVNALFKLIAAQLGSDIKPEYVDSRAGDVKDSEADLAAAGRALGWAPSVTFEDGLSQTVKWFSES